MQVCDVGARRSQQDSGHNGAVLWEYLGGRKLKPKKRRREKTLAKNILETHAKIRRYIAPPSEKKNGTKKSKKQMTNKVRSSQLRTVLMKILIMIDINYCNLFEIRSMIKGYFGLKRRKRLALIK